MSDTGNRYLSLAENKSNGGEEGIRTLGTDVSPYNGLANRFGTGTASAVPPRATNDASFSPWVCFRGQKSALRPSKTTTRCCAACTSNRSML
jgi:hypothetical protein